MSRPIMSKLRLYIAGDAQNSARAIANLAAICRAHFRDDHEVEVIDVFLEPERALADHILMTPTLIILTPGPVRRIVGNLSQPAAVLDALGVEMLPA